MADSDRYYDTGSAVNSRSSSFSSGPGGLRGSHSDTRLYERTRALRRNSSSSMSCVEASDSSSIHDSDKVHFLVKKFPWRAHWRSLDNVSSSCSSRSSVLEDDMNKLHWKSSKSAHKDVQPLDDPHNQLQVKYGSFKEVDEETEELKTDPSDWGSHCLITPRPIHLARISDTESEKNTHSPPPYSNRLKDIEYEMSLSRSSLHKPGRYATTTRIGSCKEKQQYIHDPNTSFPIACQFLTAKASICGEYESYSEQNASYKSATEGSMESLDKYESAIRDDELTISDEKNAKDAFSYSKRQGIETFSEFEEDLKQRTTKSAPSSSNFGSSTQHSSISDYIDRDKQSHPIATGSTYEHGTSSLPESPNITKIKYKGTKGFGHSPRIEYSKMEENTNQGSIHSLTSINDCDMTDKPSRLDS